MKVHFDVLGWLYISAGAVGILTGVSLWVLAGGTAVALSGRGPSPAWFLLSAGVTFVLVGGLTAFLGRALVTRSRLGRSAALAFAIPSLVVVPFGTALAVYSFWTLLNNDARREYHA